MANNQPTRRIVREVRDAIWQQGRTRTMTIEWYDGVLYVRPKGTRQRYPVNVAAVWQRAAKAEADARAKTKKAKRKIKRGRLLR